jgi:hypothetical protein
MTRCLSHLVGLAASDDPQNRAPVSVRDVGRAGVAFLSVLIVSGAACGSASGASPKATTSSTLPTSTTQAPVPAGPTPSYIARQVCSSTAQSDIARVLGVTAKVSTPTWANHLYTCNYVYSNGKFVMSVKELSSWGQTYGYFSSVGKTLGNTGKLGNLGQGAFTTSDGSVIVRKDWKVLDVNIAGLPAQFGKPPTSRADVAYTIADIILGCWAGD